MQRTHAAWLGLLLLSSCETKATRSTSEPSTGPAIEPAADGSPELQGTGEPSAAPTATPEGSTTPTSTATGTTTPTPDATGSASAQPVVCGSRFPPCPAGQTCSSPNRGVCR